MEVASATCYNPLHEKMAILGWGVHQRPFHLAGITRSASRGVLGFCKTGKLFLAAARDWCLFCWGMGAGLEMALPAGPNQEDTHQENIPNHHHWVYGK